MSSLRNKIITHNKTTCENLIELMRFGSMKDMYIIKDYQDRSFNLGGVRLFATEGAAKAALFRSLKQMIGSGTGQYLLEYRDRVEKALNFTFDDMFVKDMLEGATKNYRAGHKINDTEIKRFRDFLLEEGFFTINLVK